VACAELAVTGAADSARRIREVLAGAPGPARQVVLAGAGAALWVHGRAADVREGVEQAREAIDRGAAARLLERWARLTRPGG
jgi:anthranilate phosphoribosyltransferase